LHIALMTTVSALPYTLFTLPAGAIADMVDRKKILLGVRIWRATIAFALAILWMAHLLTLTSFWSARSFSARVSE
jgi:MFS family permease